MADVDPSGRSAWLRSAGGLCGLQESAVLVFCPAGAAMCMWHHLPPTLGADAVAEVRIADYDTVMACHSQWTMCFLFGAL